ncbi:MAG: hypothetical protein AUI48_03540 [Chloroflexi bacterium 13_1_40CM_2_68_14]|nr:MAG: hypothetical protein AUI48_03540 [Chloroflexi bacterium 13_1_40CM_2_68_14]
MTRVPRPPRGPARSRWFFSARSAGASGTLVATKGVESSLSRQAQGELEALREAYTAELPQQLAGIALAVHQLRVAPSSAALRGVVRRRAHRVAGTAGSFGYDDIGDACARIEQGVLSLAHDEGSGWREIEEAASRIAAFTSSGRAAAV